MNIIFPVNLAELPIGKKARKRHRPFQRLNNPDIVVGLFKEILAAAAATHKNSSAGGRIPFLFGMSQQNL